MLFHMLHVQKMLHRQTSVPPLIPSGQGGGAPPVNPPPAQPSAPVSQPQPVVSSTAFLFLKQWSHYTSLQQNSPLLLQENDVMSQL